MLKQTGSVSIKEAKDIKSKEQSLEAQIKKLKEQNSKLSNDLQKKQVEAAVANKKVAEMADLMKNCKKLKNNLYSKTKGRKISSKR